MRISKETTKQPTLFDLNLGEPSLTCLQQDPATCKHQIFGPSETIWPGEILARLTATCQSCGYIRGRYPGEWYQKITREEMRKYWPEKDE